MNTEHFTILLRDKERELRTNLAALQVEERVPRSVRDSIGDASASQRKSESFGEGSVLSQTLEQVQDAQHRIADGRYGKCILCGRQIEISRLQAVPWTAHCMKDQQELERKSQS